MDHARFNATLAAVFQNGRGEAGLEVGTDPGLATSEHIQIPRCLIKPWVARTSPEPKVDGAPDTAISAGLIYVHGGKLFKRADDGSIGPRLYDFQITAPTYDDVRRFVAVNLTHIRDADFDDNTTRWIHATRFWAAVSGFVATTKSNEYIVVDDPTDIPDGVNAIADFIAGYSANSWTASAARATSWRKSNHATGGEIASGFPRRWLQKEGYWPTDRDRAVQQRGARLATSAFYLATHASSVHAVLALMAPTDDDHWACIDPQFGLIPEWDVKESTIIRMVPKTQVAGVSMVTDAVVALRMLVKEGLAPLLESADQYMALATAYRTVEKNGIKAASYAGWFLDGHPNHNPRIPFNQKDLAFAELVGELGVVATKYYSNTSIGESPALDNAAKQMAPDTARQNWTALGRAKRSTAPTDMFRVYGRIKGASTSAAVNNILSEDVVQRTAAVTGYNESLKSMADAFRVANYPEMNVRTIDANAESADAQARALNTLLQAGQQ